MPYLDPDVFMQLILRASETLGIEAGIIEKDYYVTVFLGKIQEKQPDIIFKGGTSLSKCYRLINRFSEDLDLSVSYDDRLTQARRRQLKANILAVIDELGLTLQNPEEIRSRRDFNRYIIGYPVSAGADFLKSQLIVETAVFFRSFPCRRMPASSFLYDYLQEAGMDGFAEEYGILPFEVSVQSAERTFIDKIFALGDYFLSGDITERSRHIYDIYKLRSIVTIDDSLRKLAQEVAAQRRSHKTCLSAQGGIDMSLLLRRIVKEDIYRKDYDAVTSRLLFENVDYETAVSALTDIAGLGLFDT